jgi:hypothetical protein
VARRPPPGWTELVLALLVVGLFVLGVFALTVVLVKVFTDTLVTTLGALANVPW